MPCQHLSQIHEVPPGTQGCEDCLKSGGWWVHLRMCLTCGHVGCCDSSPNKHATQHPLVKSFEPGEAWAWCYVDQVFIESL